MLTHSKVEKTSRTVAVLGPTNTGKTHLAVERMLSYKTAIIGLPLRLLAREIYDRIVGQLSPGRVALITGEERIIPPNAAYIVCTVEAMPTNRKVEFIAVDEIQLCDDPERGHIFTNRLLHARGQLETMFVGAETMRGIIKQLIPGVEFITRPRFSKLTFSGERKLSRLPRKTAVVVFSSSEVYAIAELVRRQHGGAAVILGALSPRTRNAQVSLYQAGEVDYLIATDAIGMGLNMDVNHLAFASLTKFDGLNHRKLTPSEISQIAGRAGRHLNDGSFGTTANSPALEPNIAENVVKHRLEHIKRLNWRNAQLNFSSFDKLRASLRALPPRPELVRARDADDVLALEAFSSDETINPSQIEKSKLQLLWAVCQIPDFSKTSTIGHHRLLGKIFEHLTSRVGVITEDWINKHLERLDRIEGDIDTLAGRVAHIRTWTYVSNKTEWFRSALHWQERSRAIEDRLSDALHAALTQRFVDRRTALLQRSLKERRDLFGAIKNNGDVLVEGHYVGHLTGFRFKLDASTTESSTRALKTAANRVLAIEIRRRALQLTKTIDKQVVWRDDNKLWWQGAPLARLIPGQKMIQPMLEILPIDHLEGAMREKLRQKLNTWLLVKINKEFSPLNNLLSGDFSGAGRGIAYQLTENLGSITRSNVLNLIRQLTENDRSIFRRRGVQLGYLHIFLPSLLKPKKSELRVKLWVNHYQLTIRPNQPEPGLVSIPWDPNIAKEEFLLACGFHCFKNRAIRIDIVERLAKIVREQSRRGSFKIGPDILALTGCSKKELHHVIKYLGYRSQIVNGEFLYKFHPRQHKRNDSHNLRKKEIQCSPFKSLQNLKGI